MDLNQAETDWMIRNARLKECAGMPIRPLEGCTASLADELLIDQGVPILVSKPILGRLNSKGVRTMQCPKRFAYGFSTTDFEDRFSCLLDVRWG